MKKIKLFDPAIGNEEEKSIVKTLEVIYGHLALVRDT